MAFARRLVRLCSVMRSVWRVFMIYIPSKVTRKVQMYEGVENVNMYC